MLKLFINFVYFLLLQYITRYLYDIEHWDWIVKLFVNIIPHKFIYFKEIEKYYNSV